MFSRLGSRNSSHAKEKIKWTDGGCYHNMAGQLAAWDKVVTRLSAEDPFFAKVVASQKAYAKKVMGYLNLNQPNYELAYKHYFG